MIRNTLAVVVGLLGFAQGLVYVVTYGFVRPLLPTGPLWLAVLLAAVIGLGLAVGLLVGAIAGGRSPWPARIVAALATIMMIGNIILGAAVEPLWFKLCVLLLAIPSVVAAERWIAGRLARRAG